MTKQHVMAILAYALAEEYIDGIRASDSEWDATIKLLESFNQRAGR
jgi:hypothetical protein